jgi:hypothetical protein
VVVQLPRQRTKIKKEKILKLSLKREALVLTLIHLLAVEPCQGNSLILKVCKAKALTGSRKVIRKITGCLEIMYDSKLALRLLDQPNLLRKSKRTKTTIWNLKILVSTLKTSLNQSQMGLALNKLLSVR